LYECGDAVVFIDPLIPPDAESFWQWADRRVGRRRVHVVTTLEPHRRSREQVARRYGASTSRARRNLPAELHPIPLRGASETMFWLPDIRTLVPGDRILGAPGGGLRPCPESWLYWVRVDLSGLRSLLEHCSNSPSSGSSFLTASPCSTMAMRRSGGAWRPLAASGCVANDGRRRGREQTTAITASGGNP
jgi:hypothetical protein